jgi:hypothetical protein
MMGCSSVESLDYSDLEGATHVADLNCDSLPFAMIGRFDVCLTAERSTPVPNALHTALDHAKEGDWQCFSRRHRTALIMASIHYLLVDGLRLEAVYLGRCSVDPR